MTSSPATNADSAIVQLSGKVFLIACAALAALLCLLGRTSGLPVWLLAGEVFATIVGLFVLGSFRYRLDKNALTYGAGMVIFATFLGVWWEQHALRGPIPIDELQSWWPIFRYYALSFHGLDDLVHLDTMLFILGLTLFVSVVAQTRLLEGVTMALLRRNGGNVLPTVIAVTAVVAVASGIFDGVSMIGLTIRTLVIILLLAKAPLHKIRYAVMVCTIVTTICGMWLAYGEPPNLIMKANLRDDAGVPLLTDGFFLRYCLPAAAACYACVAWSLRRRFGALVVDLKGLDVLDAEAANVKFLQAAHHGQTPTPLEVAQDAAGDLPNQGAGVLQRVQGGESLGVALVKEKVPAPLREKLLERLASPELARPLDLHYQHVAGGEPDDAAQTHAEFTRLAADMSRRRARAQRIAAAAVIPFVLLLIFHGVNHHFPLFPSSAAGFLCVLPAIWSLPKMRRLALREAMHEYAEYYFLFPLFLSISLLAQVGFFDQLQTLLAYSIEHLGIVLTAVLQFYGATVLSGLLDNNVVADFASHALHNLPISVLHLFAMSQIAGYAAGGCWTHIGCAQSVVAYAFIRRDLDKEFSPISWLKEMTPLLLAIVATLTAIIAIESALRVFLG